MDINADSCGCWLSWTGALAVTATPGRCCSPSMSMAIRRHGDGTAYDWLSGPNKGYRFASSGTPSRSMEEHRESIRTFLAMIDPNTGYIGDD
jgi:hypothetical protein